MTKAQMSSLLKYVEVWSLDFTDVVAQRKADIQKTKKKILISGKVLKIKSCQGISNTACNTVVTQ